MSAPETVVHGTALLVGADGVLLRGAPASGKSLIAWRLINRAEPPLFGRLVADDQVVLSARNGRLIASPPKPLAGLIELRGRGVVAVDHEPTCVVRLIVDIVTDGAFDRMPDVDALDQTLLGVSVGRQIVPANLDLAVALIDAALAGRRPLV